MKNRYLRRGVQGQKSWKHNFEITGDAKGPPSGSTFLLGFEITDWIMGQKVSKHINYSMYGHTFFGHNSAIVLLIGLKIFMVTQETIICRLVIKDSGSGPYLQFSMFWNPLGPKKGRGPTITHMGLGPQNPTTKLTRLVDLLGDLLSRNCVSKFSDLRPPPPPLTIASQCWSVAIE